MPSPLPVLRGYRPKGIGSYMDALTAASNGTDPSGAVPLPDRRSIMLYNEPGTELELYTPAARYSCGGLAAFRR